MRASILLFCTTPLLSVGALAHHRAEPSPFGTTLTAAERAYDRRDYANALAGLRTALGLATHAENQEYVRFRIGLTLRQLRRAEEARVELRALATERPRAELAPRALFVAAQIREADLGDRAGAEGELREILRRYPRSDAAIRALRRLSEIWAERGPDGAIEKLRGVWRRHRVGPLAPHAAYLAARIAQEQLRAPEDAIRLYELIVRRHPKSGLYDDSLWRAAALHRKLGRPERAIKLYRLLTATRRESWNLGSYNSIYLDRAALEIARLYLEDLADPRRAADGFREFLSEYPHSLLRAEARKLLVRALLRLGRTDEARREVESLRRLHPTSRHTREAKALIGEPVRP